MIDPVRAKQLFEPSTTFRWEVFLTGANVLWEKKYIPVISVAYETGAFLFDEIQITPFHKVKLRHGVERTKTIQLTVYENIKNDLINFFENEIKDFSQQRRIDNEAGDIVLEIIQYDVTLKTNYKKNFRVELAGSYPITLGQEANAKNVVVEFNVIGDY